MAPLGPRLSVDLNPPPPPPLGRTLIGLLYIIYKKHHYTNMISKIIINVGGTFQKCIFCKFDPAKGGWGKKKFKKYVVGGEKM